MRPTLAAGDLLGGEVQCLPPSAPLMRTPFVGAALGPTPSRPGPLPRHAGPEPAVACLQGPSPPIQPDSAPPASPRRQALRCRPVAVFAGPGPRVTSPAGAAGCELRSAGLSRAGNSTGLPAFDAERVPFPARAAPAQARLRRIPSNTHAPARRRVGSRKMEAPGADPG